MSAPRCAGRACRHAASRHDQAGRCQVCQVCPGYAPRRRHTWREAVVDSWLTETLIWEQRIEDAGGRLWRGARNTEWREFVQHNPAPRLAQHMRQLSAGIPHEERIA